MKKQTKSDLKRELRQDILTGHWVVITDQRSPLLGKNLEFPLNNPDEDKDFPMLPEYLKGLFFVDGHKPTIIDTVYSQDKEEFMYIVPSEFAVLAEDNGKEERYFATHEGPFLRKKAVGVHELMVCKDSKRIYELSESRLGLILEAIQQRYLALASHKEIKCLFWYHACGQSAGASFEYTHAQLVGMPVVPEFIEEKFEVAESYYRAHKRSVYEVMLEYELERQARVVYETDDFALICPFASRSAFEMMILPKDHNPFFERTLPDERAQVAKLLSKGLGALKKTFAKDLDFNVYLYSAPVDGSDHKYFRWHLSIVPYLYVWEGLEMGAGMDICEVSPEVATVYLKRFF
jgi:UDPglucose--hexose-1-phosphate uridylyltransferase